MEGAVTVLVVDDDHRMVKTLCDILRIKGHKAIPAYSGEEALEKIRPEMPDCVLMDIRMPGISGVEATEMIRLQAPDLPVILMSAYPTDEQTLEANRHGAYSVLTKPVDLHLVLSFLSLLRKEESILIVDDDEAFCRTLKDILQARGYRVETEINPVKVMDHMERNYKLAVILDLKLGNIDGLDVLKDIRARYPSKPVVLVTGYGRDMTDSIEKGLAIGAYTCLYKPFETEAIIGIVEEISRKKLRSFLGAAGPSAAR
jgi:two-component system response regulator HydG